MFDAVPLISDQISRAQLDVILRELDQALDRNPEGSIVEFGCYIGTTSLFIRHLLDDYESKADTHTSSSCAFSRRATDRAVSKYGEGSSADEKRAGAEEAGSAAGSASRQADRCVRRRELHVYDSFAGLPPKVEADLSPAGEQFKAGELAVSKKQFLAEFRKASLQPPIVHKGWFSQLTAADVPDQIAFAYLDGDFYESIRDSLQLVLSKMTEQGTIVIDDYAREALPGVAAAVRDTAPQLLDKIKVQNNQAIIRL